MSLSLIDFGILGVLALALVRGYMVGGLRQITSIIGMVLAFIFAVLYMRPLGVQVEAWGISPVFSELVAFMGIFLVVFIGVSLVTRMLAGILKALRLGLLDNVLGSVLSAGKVLLVISGVFLLLAQAGWPAADTREASAFYEPVRDALPIAWDHTAAYVGDTEELDAFFPDVEDAAHRSNTSDPKIERLFPTDLMRIDDEASPPANNTATDPAPDEARTGW